MAGNLTAMIAAAFSGSAAPPVTSDPYFDYTTLLLPGNGTNGAQNNTFLDSSTNNFTITRNGNTTQGTFSPFSQTGWGNYFRGSSDLLRISVSALSSSSFTVEGWIFYTGASNVNSTIFDFVNAVNGYGIYVAHTSAGNLSVIFFSNNTGTQIGSISSSFSGYYNQWVHIAFTYDGATYRMFVNGDLTGTPVSSATQVVALNSLTIGARGDSSPTQVWAGYISNVRYVTGAALYTSNFTPSTTPLSIAGSGTTQLLTCQSNRFVDNSSSPKTITVTGSPSVQAFSPFNPTSSWSATTYGGSGYFDGSGDSVITSSTDTAFNLGSSDWTMECWVYLTSLSNFASFIYCGLSNSDGHGLSLFSTSRFSYFLNGAEVINSGVAPVINQWYHVALSRSSGTTTLYINGESKGTTTSAPTSKNYYAVCGMKPNNVEPMFGYVSNSRIVKGTAVYTSNFTPPTAPLTAITNTSLLLNFTNAGIYDATSKNDLETVGNAQISTSVSKFGGGSIAFDGTGDYLLTNGAVTDLLAFGTGDFCIEMWVNFSSLTGTPSLLDARPASTNGAYVFLYANGSSSINLYVSSAIRITGTVSLSTGVWYHVAVARSSGSTRLYVAGNQVGSTYSDTTSYLGATGRPAIGTSGGVLGNDALNGYIDDLRITKGNARGYTGSTITVPTAPFPVQ